MWDMLVTRYEARAYAEVSHVIHELHTNAYSPGSSMQKHITDLRGLQHKLLLMGSRLDKEGFILATTDDIQRSDLEGVWILDSACTTDVTGNKALLTKLARTQLSALQLADNSTVQPMHMGLLSIQVDADHRLDRPNAKFVPNLKKNLLSLRLLLRDCLQVAKWDLDVAIMSLDTFVLKFTHHRGLYVLQQYEEHINSCLVRQSTPKLVLWHLRLAHLNFAAIKQAARDGSMEGRLHLS
ncbi:hypothetical protein DYB26_011825, partial [Aphanomyces astaci]